MSNIERRKFSAFKLFYDEIIYKENVNVSYSKIKRNVKKIKELITDIRKTNKSNIELYNDKLERINKRLKLQLNYMYEANSNVFKYYLSLYKINVLVSNDSVSEMPFIISCSFYEDYRLDGKNIEKLEDDKNLVPLFSSGEKRDIRENAKEIDILSYFLSVINDLPNASKYKRMVDKINTILAFRPNYKESHYDFCSRIDGLKKSLVRMIKRNEVKARENGDYKLISNIMHIAYRKKFINWEDEIIPLLNNKIDEIYEDSSYTVETLIESTLTNNMPFDLYDAITKELLEEKEKYDKQFNECKFKPIIIKDSSYLAKDREVLINDYYDLRLQIDFNKVSTYEEYVDVAINFYKVSEDIVKQLFNKNIFDAINSDLFNRDNNVSSSLIVKLYNLYNPKLILKKYLSIKKEFEKMLDNRDFEFKHKYNSLLMDRKVNLNLHVIIPNEDIINTKLNDKKMEFIANNIEMQYESLSKDYDTRDYDLKVIADGLNIKDLVTLYNLIKRNVMEGNFGEPNKYQKIKLKKVQKFICELIFELLKKKENVSLHDICINYLKDDVYFEGIKKDDDIVNKEDNVNKFNEVQSKFIIKSKWFKLCNKYKVKNVGR